MGKHLGEKKWKELVWAWRKSGKSQGVFSEEHGIRSYNLSEWNNRLKRENKRAFFELPLRPKAAELFGRSEKIEIWINNCHRVLVPANFDLTEVREMIKKLEGV